jgi:hypothetical protein
MKKYSVWYVIKANRAEWLHKIEVEAASAREAIKVCKAQVLLKTGKNAFRPSTNIESFFKYAITPEKKAEKLADLEKLGYCKL